MQKIITSTKKFYIVDSTVLDAKNNRSIEIFYLRLKNFLIVKFPIIFNVKYKSHQFFLFLKFFDQKLQK